MDNYQELVTDLNESFFKQARKDSIGNEVRNPDFERFRSDFIRSMQDAYVEESKIEEFRKILNTPTGELIIQIALFASKRP